MYRFMRLFLGGLLLTVASIHAMEREHTLTIKPDKQQFLDAHQKITRWLDGVFAYLLNICLHRKSVFNEQSGQSCIDDLSHPVDGLRIKWIDQSSPKDRAEKITAFYRHLLAMTQKSTWSAALNAFKRVHGGNLFIKELRTLLNLFIISHDDPIHIEKQMEKVRYLLGYLSAKRI